MTDHIAIVRETLKGRQPTARGLTSLAALEAALAVAPALKPTTEAEIKTEIGWAITDCRRMGLRDVEDYASRVWSAIRAKLYAFDQNISPPAARDAVEAMRLALDYWFTKEWRMTVHPDGCPEALLMTADRARGRSYVEWRRPEEFTSTPVGEVIVLLRRGEIRGWIRASQFDDRVIAWAEMPVPPAWAQSPEPCQTCGGTGEVGGFVGSIGSGAEGYQTDPCPDCTAAPERRFDNAPRDAASNISTHDPGVAALAGGAEPDDDCPRCRGGGCEWCHNTGKHHILMPLSDANDLDAVVHVLGIEDSDTTPAEVVAELKAEIERVRKESPPTEPPFPPWSAEKDRLLQRMGEWWMNRGITSDPRLRLYEDAYPPSSGTSDARAAFPETPDAG